MRMVPLGEFMPSGIPTVDPQKSPSEVFELWSIPAFDNGKPDIVSGDQIGSAKKSVEPGDVLLSRIVPHIRRAWIVSPGTSNRQIASGEWITFRSAEVYPPYLRQVLVSDPFHAQFMQTVAGVGGSLLRARPDGVKQIEIPLPPLEEQRRIAGILDQADALRRLRTRALDMLNTLGQAIFHEMFGDLRTNELVWQEGVTLGELADVVSGITKGRKVKNENLREVPYLAVSNVQDRFLKMGVVKTIEATEDEIDRYRLRRDDLLLTEGGDPDKLGRGTLWKEQLPECIHQNHVFRVRVRDGRVRPTFLSWQLGSERGKQYFLRSAKQTTGIASINKTQINAFPLLLPPVVLQQKFEEQLNDLEARLGAYEAAGVQAESLFTSLQHRAFRGEL
ncbi:restriction endonuclease subunit S [Rhodobacter capsulatus]|uniref:restriction endonuclease subunit S n=1 Tax=Rhodobacter capsulatus TaxID=1061 RepID=UPI00114330D1|nr:restriction endonuclease subunit S [Rhodobacter capsulatus]TQD35585.1 restriction endonuclease subunit S [Rhodobacter capsulatus]